MKKFFNILAIIGCTLIFSCVSKRKTDTTPIKFTPPPAPVATYSPDCCPADPDSMIPFTRDLYNRLRLNNQDIRKLQFFVDQTIILSRGLSQDKLYIDQGKVVNQYGVNENKIEIPALTPGVVEAIEPDGVRVAFENGNNLKFINNKYSPEFFIFSGVNWDNGTAEVPYRGTTYRASCATCGSVSEAKLVVRQKDVMTGNTNSAVLPGKTVH